MNNDQNCLPDDYRIEEKEVKSLVCNLNPVFSLKN